MKIIVTKDKVKIEEFDLVHEGEHRVNKCSFSFSEDFTEDLVKKAIFTLQNDSIEVPIINNECDIPGEILKARNIVLLGVYAYKITGDKLVLRYSPSPDAFKVNSGSYIEGVSESEEITPSQFEQYMQALNDGLNKIEESLKKMDSATSSATQLVNDINQKLENGDFIGPEGPQGVPGDDGTNGTDGADGVGITSITSGQSTVEEDKTITPITVTKTDGSSQIFNVEAKNGIDGQNGKDGTNGQDGLTPTIGDNGNWYLGDTDTGKPSRGEVGPSPDLSNYVQFDNYPSNEKAGVIKLSNNFMVNPSNGYVYAKTLDATSYYENTDSASFISKGTLENIKDDYVGSSTPVQDLTATVTNVQNDQDEGIPKNTASGEMITVDDAIAYKIFNVTVDGASEQITTTGKNLLPYPYVDTTKTENGITFTDNRDGTITVNGTATAGVFFKVFATQTNQEEIPGNYISGSVTGCNIVVAHKQDTTYTSLGISSNGSSSLINKETYATGYIELSILKGTTLNNVIVKPMLTLEQDTSYEPYTGGQPSPSPDYPQEITTLTFDKITRCGKNLATENFANQNSSINLARTLKKGEKITIVVNMTATDNPPSGYGMNIYDQDNEQLWGNSYANWQQSYDGWNSFVATVKNDTSILRINSYGYQEVEIPTAILSGALVEENKYIHDGSLYEPYEGQIYDIDLQGNEMVELPNGAKDELVIDKYGNVSLIKNVGKIVFDGSDDENWFVLDFAPRPLFDIRITDILSLLDQSIKNPTLCTNFISYSPNDIWMTNITGICIVQDSNVIRIGFKDNPYQTSEEFKSWLSTHNTILYYPLANQQTIPLGTLSELITTLNGTNNIFINGNIPTTISTTYALDIKKYIDNKLAEISAQMIEEG